MNYKPYAIFFSIIAAGTAVFYFVSSGYYPIAMVNYKFISARTFMNDYTAVSLYYQNTLKVYNSADAASSMDSTSSQPSLEAAAGTVGQAGTSDSLPPQVPTPLQMQQSVLNGLVERVLIDGGARKEVGKELDRFVDEKVNKAVSAQDIEKAVKVVYGISLDDFKKEILVPQAKRDALTGSLFLKGEKIDDWLAEAKKSSRVIIFSGKFYWNGEEVVAK